MKRTIVSARRIAALQGRALEGSPVIEDAVGATNRGYGSGRGAAAKAMVAEADEDRGGV